MEETEKIGALELEWVINNPELMQQLKQSEKAVDTTADKVEARMKTATNAIDKIKSKGGWSDSKAEIDAYLSSLKAVGDSARVAANGTDELLRIINADLAAGKISVEEFKTAIADIAKAQELNAQAEEKANQPLKEQIGLLERLQAQLKDLRDTRPFLKTAADVERANVEIVALETEIKRLDRLGVDAFNRMNSEIKKPVGQIEKLIYVSKLYEKQIKQAANPEIIAKYNGKLEAAKEEITRLGNVGKKGFDELGNAVKKAGEGVEKTAEAANKSTGYFTKAWSGLKMIANILPGLGIAGLIGFATGPIIEYIAALYKGSLALDAVNIKLREQLNLQKAVDAVRVKAAESSASEMARLTELYRITQNLTLSQKDRVNAAIELQNSYPQTFANFTTEAILAGKATDAYKLLRKEIIQLAYAKAITDTIGENSVRLLKDNQGIKAEEREQRRLKQVQSKSANDYNTAVRRDDRDMAFATNVQATRDLKASQRRMDDMITDKRLVRQTIKELEDALEETVKKGGSKVLTNGKMVVSESAKAALESQKTIIQTDLETQNIISQNQAKGLKERRDALKKALDDNMQLIDISQREELLNTNITAAQKKAIEGKFNAQKIKAQAQYEKDLAGLQEKKEGKTAEQQEKEWEAAQKRRKALMTEIADTVNNVQRKELSADQAALKAISDKFNALRDKIKTFNADKSNSFKISADTYNELDIHETDALNNQRLINVANYTRAEIETKKAAYAEYYAYREKLGDAAAKKEYAELLKSGQSFIAYLSNLAKAIPAGPLNEAFKSLQDLVNKSSEDESKQQRLHLIELLKDSMTYAEKGERISETYLRRVKELRDAGAKEAAEQMELQGQAELERHTLQNEQTLESYRTLYVTIQGMTAQQARLRIKEAEIAAKAAKAAGTISPEAFEEIIKLIKQAEAAIPANAIVHFFDDTAEAVGNLSESLRPLDEGLANTFSLMARGIKQVADVKRNFDGLQNSIANYSKNKTAAGGGLLGSISAGGSILSSVTGIIGSVIGVVGTIVSLFDRSKQRAEQQAYELAQQEKQQQAINKALERQAKLLKEIYGTERLTAYKKALTDIKAQQENLAATVNGRLLLTGDKVLDEAITKYNNGDKSYNKLLLSKNVIEQIRQAGLALNLAGKSMEDLQKMVDSGKFDDATARMVQSLIDLQQQATDTFNELKAEITGTAFDSILDEVVSLFRNATTTAQDFAANFEKIIQQAILNSFKRNALEKQLQGFYDAFYDAANSDNKLTTGEIANLRKLYDGIIANSKKQFDDLEKATGIKLTDGAGASSSSSTLAGQIKGITAEQANVLEGAIRGMQQAVIQTNTRLADTNNTAQAQLAELKSQTMQLLKIEVNTKRAADNTDGIKDSLSNIDKNTANSYGVQLRAAGKYGY